MPRLRPYFNPAWRRIFWRALGLLALVLLLIVGRPVAFLLAVWWRDPATAPAPHATGTNDASGLSPNVPREVVAIAADPGAAEQQIADLVRRATEQHLHLAISGAGHSMGGHTLYPGGVILDMLPFRGLTLEPGGKLLRAGAGARWADIIPFLDQHGLAVAVMQSNSDFTVGGSLSVNCHGWQFAAPPIASTVESFRLVTAAGRVVTCSRTENVELFSLVLGGYGLFGVILDAELRVVPNEFYRAEAHPVRPADYAQTFADLTRGRTDIGMAYGRISVAPDSFLGEGMIVLLQRQEAGRPTANTLTANPHSELNRLIFRGSVGSDYGKNLRWRLEKWFGETGAGLLSRNQIMIEPADLYGNRDPASTEILHEYFVPAARLGEFLERARPVLLKRHPDLLNITIRQVQADPDTVLRYARENVFALVMLFHQGLDAAAETAMQALTRDLIDVALACGGTYYLPYRPHATVAQFARGYPQAAAFFAAKQRYDPAGIFTNEFYQNYGPPQGLSGPPGN